jgi:hypothetical protein
MIWRKRCVTVRKEWEEYSILPSQAAIIKWLKKFTIFTKILNLDIVTNDKLIVCLPYKYKIDLKIIVIVYLWQSIRFFFKMEISLRFVLLVKILYFTIII